MKKILLICLIISAISQLHGQLIYWSDDENLEIRRANMDGSENIETVYVMPDLNGPSPNGAFPAGIDIDESNGHIYFSHNSGALIQRMDLLGQNVVTIQSGFPNVVTPRGLAIDIADNLIFWQHGQLNQIKKGGIAPGSNDGTVVTTAPPLNTDVAVDKVNNKVYWVSGFQNGNDMVGWANYDGTGAGSVNVGTDAPLSIDVGGSFFYWVEFTTNTLMRANLDGTGATNMNVTGLSGPRALAVDPSGGFIYIGNYTTENICRVPLAGNAPCTVLHTNVGQPVMMALAPNTPAISSMVCPTVSVHPTSQAQCEGGMVSFTSDAMGTPAPTVQWQRSTDGGSNWNNIMGATLTTYMIATLTTSENGHRFRAIFTNTCGSDTSNVAILTVTPLGDPAFYYPKNAYCRLGTDPSPVIAGAAGGTFSAPPQVSINPSTGLIDLSSSTVGGLYDITYNTGGICPDLSVFSLSIVNCNPGAEMTDQLTGDNDGDGEAGPGDIITMTVKITNADQADYEDGKNILGIDSELSLVPGSFKSTPVAVDDRYSTSVNMLLSIMAGSGLIQNDFDDNIPGLAVTAFDNMSANGGNVMVSPDGSFTYMPPSNFSGTDSFNYTISDSDNQVNSAVVRILVH